MSEPIHAQDAPATQQYLTFRVAGQTYAIASRYVCEIIEPDQLTMVPMTPALVRGVINLRGCVVPIIDLALRFDAGRGGLGQRSCIVIVALEEDGETHRLGALVDAVSAVIELEPQALRPAPTFGNRIRSDFIEDMARIDERFVTLLRLEQVLSATQIAALVGRHNVAAGPTRIAGGQGDA